MERKFGDPNRSFRNSKTIVFVSIVDLNETGGARLLLMEFIPLSSVHPCIVIDPHKKEKSLQYAGFNTCGWQVLGCFVSVWDETTEYTDFNLCTQE